MTRPNPNLAPVIFLLVGFLVLVSGPVHAQITNQQVAALDSTDVQTEFKSLQAQDDAAQAEVDKWKAEAAAGKGSGDLKQRIEKRVDPVRKAYETFLAKHPNHVEGHLTFGSFLNEQEDEAGAQVEWEKALKLEPTNAAALYNLANRYAETGRVAAAFTNYARAIELKPGEATYYHGYADALYVRRKFATAHFHQTEQEIFARCVDLYQKAVRLDPTNFLFATDLAQTYYAIAPLPVNEALQAWTNAVKIASNETQRQSAYVHLARVKMLAGKFAEARDQLKSVTNEASAQFKETLLKHIREREKE
jgi:tetratricopeptide (TPR) repeat protein